MKKNVRSLLIMLAVLAVLGGAAAVLVGTSPDGDAGESGSSAVSQDERETIEFDTDNISSIAVQNNEGGFTLLPGPGAAQGESSSQVEEPETVFVVEGLEGYDLDTASISSAVDSLTSLTIHRDLGAQADLGQYGLDEGQAVRVAIQEKSGGETVLLLGNASSSGGTAGQYILKDGSVCIVTALSAKFRGPALDLVSRDVYTVASDFAQGTDSEGNETQTALPDTLYSAEISGQAFPELIRLGYVETQRLNGHMVTSPVLAESGTAAFDALVASLKSLTASKVQAVGVAGQGLAEYGLSQPDARIEFNLNGQQVALQVSAKDSDGSRYLTMDGRDVVYQVANAQVSAWAEASLMDLRMATVCLANIADVRKLSLTQEGDMAYAFTVTPSETTDLADSTVVNAAGQEIGYENYQAFYKQLIGLSVFSMEKPSYGGVPTLRVEYTYEEGTDVVEFYPVQGQDRCAAVLNGQFNGLVRGADVDKLLALLPDLHGGTAAGA